MKTHPNTNCAFDALSYKTGKMQSVQIRLMAPVNGNDRYTVEFLEMSKSLGASVDLTLGQALSIVRPWVRKNKAHISFNYLPI